MRKQISAEVPLIHAERMSLYNFIILRKKQWTQIKTKQLKQDILNQQESIGFPKLYWQAGKIVGGKKKLEVKKKLGVKKKLEVKK